MLLVHAVGVAEKTLPAGVASNQINVTPVAMKLKKLMPAIH
jgi:hypothetical protein